MFEVYRGQARWYAPSPSTSELPWQNHSDINQSKYLHVATDTVPRQLFTNVRSDWMRVLSPSQTGNMGLGAQAILLRDSVVTFVGNGAHLGTQITRIDLQGNILHTAAMIPNPEDTVWRLYYTSTDARLLENGDIQLAGWVEGWRRSSILGIGAIASARYTNDNKLVIGPHRYYTHVNPGPVPTDINRIAPADGYLGNGDTAYFMNRNYDRAKANVSWLVFSRIPGTVGDTNLIVNVAYNAIDTFTSALDLDILYGGNLLFNALHGVPIYAEMFGTTNGARYARFMILNKNLERISDCVFDSIGLFKPVAIDADSFQVVFWDSPSGALVRRSIGKGCVIGQRQVLYRSPVRHQIYSIFYRRNGNIVLSGIATANELGNPNGGASDDEKGFAMEITPQGKLIWKYQIGRDDFGARVAGVKELPDGSFILCGYFDYTTGFITRIRPDGTMSAADDAGMATPPNIVVSPNPCGPGDDLALRLPESGTFDVEILDQSGRAVSWLPAQTFEAHTNRIIEHPELSAGTYMVIARSNGRYYSGRLVKY